MNATPAWKIAARRRSCQSAYTAASTTIPTMSPWKTNVPTIGRGVRTTWRKPNMSLGVIKPKGHPRLAPEDARANFTDCQIGAGTKTSAAAKAPTVAAHDDCALPNPAPPELTDAHCGEDHRLHEEREGRVAQECDHDDGHEEHQPPEPLTPAGLSGDPMKHEQLTEHERHHEELGEEVVRRHVAEQRRQGDEEGDGRSRDETAGQKARAVSRTASAPSVTTTRRTGNAACQGARPVPAAAAPSAATAPGPLPAAFVRDRTEAGSRDVARPAEAVGDEAPGNGDVLRDVSVVGRSRSEVSDLEGNPIFTDEDHRDPGQQADRRCAPRAKGGEKFLRFAQPTTASAISAAVPRIGSPRTSPPSV